MFSRHFGAPVATVALAVSAHASSLYVDQNATGPAHNGSSWCNAYLNVQDALLAAAPGTTIRVADGTYNPDQGGGQTPGALSATFQLRNGVTLEGGYAGCGAPEPDARDIELYETILSGDLGDANSYHVVTGSGTDASAVIDGFTITGGFASGAAPSGAGVFNFAGHPTVRNCTITGNTAQLSGAGMYNKDSSPTITNCTFSQNWIPSGASGGAGMHNSNSHPVITDCRFIGNMGPPSCVGNCASGWGGGMFNVNSNPTLINCEFRRNTTGGGGGAMNNHLSSPTLTNCTFDENEVLNGWGGALMNDDGEPTIWACTFSRNSARLGGGAMFNLQSNPTVADCAFVANRVSSTSPGGAISNQSSAPWVINCTFTLNVAREGSAMASIFSSAPSPKVINSILWGNASPQITNIQSTTGVSWTILQGGGSGFGVLNSDPLFVDADGPDNVPGTADDNLRLMPGSPAIDSGWPDFVAEPGQTDLDGKPRVLCGRVDRGAYEFGLVGDINCDRALNLGDVAEWPSCETGPGQPTSLGTCQAFDFHTDGLVDLRDFARLQLAIGP